MLLAAVLLMAAGGASPARAEATHEYDLKAVFLYNFATFTDWPKTAFETAESPLVIGVLGDDPFGSALDEAVANEKVQGRALRVDRYARLQDVTACHLLFISASEVDRVDRIVAQLRGRPILIVSDIERFAARGGMVGFVNEGSRVRLAVNLRAVKSANLALSSKLLRLARVVDN